MPQSRQVKCSRWPSWPRKIPGPPHIGQPMSALSLRELADGAAEVVTRLGGQVGVVRVHVDRGPAAVLRAGEELPSPLDAHRGLDHVCLPSVCLALPLQLTSSVYRTQVAARPVKPRWPGGSAWPGPANCVSRESPESRYCVL